MSKHFCWRGTFGRPSLLASSYTLHDSRPPALPREMGQVLKVTAYANTGRDWD